MEKRKALILGGRTGLVGQALAHVMDRGAWQIICPDRKDLDIFSGSRMEQFIHDHEVEFVFNAVGYTRIDQAQDEPGAALALNKNVPALLGKICRRRNIYLIHYSTGSVFSGTKDTPYTTQDPPSSRSIYGQTKLEGEKALLSEPWDRLLVIRTSWLFGPFKTNFVDRIITTARGKNSISVVHDQVGSPTYTIDLARYTLDLVDRGTSGLFHLVNKGQASWCELASEAICCAGLYCRTTPVPSSDYPRKAPRPAYSVLDCSKYSVVTGLTPRSWIQSLREYIYHYQQESC